MGGRGTRNDGGMRSAVGCAAGGVGVERIGCGVGRRGRRGVEVWVETLWQWCSGSRWGGWGVRGEGCRMDGERHAV